nr:geraniol 8-hydroxylase-like [Tanacetum cinerariifolium]
YYSDAWLLEDSTRSAPHRDAEILQERMKCFRRLFPNDDEHSIVLDEYTKLAQRYGPTFKLKLGSKTHIIVGSSDLAKVVLHEQDEIFANRDPPIAGTVFSYGGHDIIWSDNNSLWCNMHKVFAIEVLSNKNLDASNTFRRGRVRKTIKQVYGTMGTEVDIGGIAFLTSLDVVMNMVWAKSLVEYVKSTNLRVAFREVITKVMELLGAMNVSDFFLVLSRYDLQGVRREMKRQNRVLWEVTKETTATGIWTKLTSPYMTKSLANRLYLRKKLYTYYMSLGTKLGDHLDEFNNLILDLVNINIEIEDEDQALMLFTSLPLSYENFVETLLYERKSLTIEDQ